MAESGRDLKSEVTFGTQHELKPKERVIATVRGESVDKLPVHHIQFSGYAASVILGREVYVGGGFLQWREIQALWKGKEAHQAFVRRCEADAVALAEACGHDILRLDYWRWPKEQKPVKKIDNYTILFGNPDKEWYTITYDPERELLVRKDGLGHEYPRDSKNLETGEMTEDTLRQAIYEEEKLTENYNPPLEPDNKLKSLYDKYSDYILKFGTETVHVDVGSVQDLMALASWPKLFARKCLAQAKRIATDLKRMADSGMKINFSGWDFCSQRGPMVSPSTLREVLMPALKIIVDACHENDIYYFYSSDGNFWPVADDMFNMAGVDGWFEVDRSSGMDLHELRKKFPDKSFIGNIRSQVLHQGTKEDVVEEVMSCLKIAHQVGGIIIGTSNMIMPGTPPENIVTMLKLIEENR